jgi:hypothetical protein
MTQLTTTRAASTTPRNSFGTTALVLTLIGPGFGLTTTAPRNSFGITALVLALIGIGFGLLPFTAVIALTLGMLAMLFGLLGWSRTREGVATNSKTAVIGTILGICAITLGIWGIWGIVTMFGAR